MAIGVFYCSNEQPGIEMPDQILEDFEGEGICCWQETDDEGLYCVTIVGSEDPDLDDLQDSLTEIETARLVGDEVYLPRQMRERLGQDYVIVTAYRRVDIWPESDWEAAKQRINPDSLAAALEELGL